MRQQIRVCLAGACVMALAGCTTTSHTEAVNNASNLTLVDAYTLAGKKDFLRDYPPTDSEGNINVVIEIPTGTNGKWEVEKDSGQLKWEFKKGKPRIVSYLGYPGNYGMIPGTLLSKELGGDGDPLDVLVLGPAVPRGTVVSVRPIGVLKMLDDGEHDDKIIAVLIDSPLGRISSIKELRKKFNGITDILETWFSNYKGPGRIQSSGFGSSNDAQRVIKAAVKAYNKTK